MHILFLGPIAVKTTVICTDLQSYVLSGLNIHTLSAIHQQVCLVKIKCMVKASKINPCESAVPTVTSAIWHGVTCTQ